MSVVHIKVSKFWFKNNELLIISQDEEITATCSWAMCEQLEHKCCISEDVFPSHAFFILKFTPFFFSWASRIYLWRHWYVIKLSPFKFCSYHISWRKANLTKMAQQDRRTKWHIPDEASCSVASSVSVLFITISSSLSDNKLMLYSHCAEEAITGSSIVSLSSSIAFYHDCHLAPLL